MRGGLSPHPLTPVGNCREVERVWSRRRLQVGERVPQPLAGQMPSLLRARFLNLRILATLYYTQERKIHATIPLVLPTVQL